MQRRLRSLMLCHMQHTALQRVSKPDGISALTVANNYPDKLGKKHMASGTNYSQQYGQAEKAYLESNFALAAETIDRLAEEFPDDPNILLLRGHIYCYGFQEYDLAKHEYQTVLELSDRQDLLDFARSGIEQLEQLQQQSQLSFDEDNLELPEILGDEDGASSISTEDFPETKIAVSNLDEVNSGDEEEGTVEQESFNFESDYHSELEHSAIEEFSTDDSYSYTRDYSDNSLVENLTDLHQSLDSEDTSGEDHRELTDAGQSSENRSSTFMMDFDDSLPDYNIEDFAAEQREYENRYNNASELEVDTVLTEPFAVRDTDNHGRENIPEREEIDYQNELEFDEIDSSFFDLEELEQGLPDTGLFNAIEESNSSDLDVSDDLSIGSNVIAEEIAISGASGAGNTFANTAEERPKVEVQGKFSTFINAPIQKKQFITAAVTGIVSAIAVLGIGIIGSSVIARQDTERNFATGARNSLLLALVAGVSSAGTSAALGSITAKHINKATEDLQNQFDEVYQGNLNAKATVYSQDEFGQLASGFNRMTKVILTTTQEAQRRAEETEQAKEDLQRQVIRLLDDVEGAARGDLTVQATVTADVLGAVADAFNLTIQSLREIVRQVKEAAEKVNKGSTDSESYARNQSNEALRMAEELAVTLNSVQMMTESIERVADNAREAEEVARSSSVTALKGGKAVERTVSGIFQIRETVSETARKVKRLAEASQEISKIVLLISQIAERTNQLALNASIQAAKAGEAGRGFAVVADEVRQLADRSGKSLKEIEQIVLQIQSETGSVMTAMEEGIQEVIDVTERAEQAKTALEDIIQVSNRIDTLVRSITADTVEQRENSRAVAQVMQSVELTAQATSQESQRVGGALQSLVGIARGLLSSVERFRIDRDDE